MNSEPEASASVKQTEDYPPNHSLYVHNLNDKIKPDRLKESLYSSFSQYGKILDICIFKARFLRGQAWVTFDDISSASNALRGMNDTLFFEKPLHIQFAKQKAHVIAQRDGTYQPREKRKRSENDSNTKKENGNGLDRKAMQPPPPPPRPMQQYPHHILFIQSLPESCNQDMLRVLFEQYHGYKEVRMVPGKDMAFVEFGDEAQASIALQGLYGFKLTPTDTLQISFAKK